MREIKFRAWDKKYKYMNYKVIIGNTVDQDERYTAHAMFIYPENVDYKCIPHWVNFDENSDIILMQYTGLKDKNEKEIFEGDAFERNGHIGIVKYINNKFVIEYDDKKIIDLFEDLFWNSKFCELEIIGNIYENPDLIKIM